MPDLTAETKKKLIKARNVMEDLKQEAETHIASGGLDPDTEVVERDVSGATNKFLSDTKDEKLTRKRRVRPNKDPKLEDGWTTLRFRITLEQRDIIMAAMERAKELSTQIPGKRAWKGVMLEYVAAEFLASNGYPQTTP